MKEMKKAVGVRIDRCFEGSVKKLGKSLMSHRSFIQLLIVSYFEIKEDLTLPDLELKIDNFKLSNKVWTMNLPIKESLHTKLVEEARRNGLKTGQLLRKIIILYLSNESFLNKINPVINKSLSF